MTGINKLVEGIKRKKSFLCVGLDTDPDKIPPLFRKEANPVLAYNKAIIENTLPYTVSYKINTAFYESQGVAGWQCMQDTLKLIPKDVFTIADAKRGDIGNTASQYAKAFFESLSFDSLTLSPYMGIDTLLPYLEYPDKVLICLALTSNPGAQNFEMQTLQNGNKLYEEVISQASKAIDANRLMFVAGATQSSELRHLRTLIPEHFLLIPGVGSQGGTVEEVANNTFLKEKTGILINVSRAIIFAKGLETTTTDIAEAAAHFQKQMEVYFEN